MAQVYAEATSKTTQPWWRRLINAIPANRALTAVGAVAVVAALVFGIWGTPGRKQASPAPISYTVSGGTSQQSVTGTLDVDTAANQSVLTVHGPRPPAEHRGLRGMAHPRHGAPKGVAFLAPSRHRRRVDGGGERRVSPATRRIAATNEPTGGSPAPTGPQVLIGQLTSILRRAEGRADLRRFSAIAGRTRLIPGVVDDHAPLAFAIALPDTLSLGLGQIGLSFHAQAADACEWRLPRVTATPTAAAASVTTVPPATACTRRSSPSERSVAATPRLRAPAIARGVDALPGLRVEPPRIERVADLDAGVEHRSHVSRSREGGQIALQRGVETVGRGHEPDLVSRSAGSGAPSRRRSAVRARKVRSFTAPSLRSITSAISRLRSSPPKRSRIA